MTDIVGVYNIKTALAGAEYKIWPSYLIFPPEQSLH